MSTAKPAACPVVTTLAVGIISDRLVFAANVQAEQDTAAPETSAGAQPSSDEDAIAPQLPPIFDPPRWQYHAICCTLDMAYGIVRPQHPLPGEAALFVPFINGTFVWSRAETAQGIPITLLPRSEICPVPNGYAAHIYHITVGIAATPDAASIALDAYLETYRDLLMGPGAIPCPSCGAWNTDDLIACASCGDWLDGHAPDSDLPTLLTTNLVR